MTYDRFIFSSLFPSKVESLLSVYVRILSLKHQKENLNGIKRSKISFLGLQVLMTGL